MASPAVTRPGILEKWDHTEVDMFWGPEPDRMMGGSFICPNCGGSEVADVSFVSSLPPEPGDPNPYAGVLYLEACAGCRIWIPGHLAERWDGLTEEEARQEWQEKFAESPYLERYDEREYEEEDEEDEDDDLPGRGDGRP